MTIWGTWLKNSAMHGKVRVGVKDLTNIMSDDNGDDDGGWQKGTSWPGWRTLRCMEKRELQVGLWSSGWSLPIGSTGTPFNHYHYNQHDYYHYCDCFHHNHRDHHQPLIVWLVASKWCKRHTFGSWVDTKRLWIVIFPCPWQNQNKLNCTNPMVFGNHTIQVQINSYNTIWPVSKIRVWWTHIMTSF